MRKYFLLACVALGVGFTACDDEHDELVYAEVIEDSQPSAVNPAKGFYVANEDWFGHDNGTVNYFKVNGNEYDIVYRAYRAANADEELGVTTQYATTWGDNIYLVSKQGNRLVVADANTLQKKAVFTEIGGDGRSFLGVDDKLGYIGHANGICQFDITNLQLGDPVEGISGQIGTMCYAEGRVFAVSNKNVYIIDVTTNKIEKTLVGSFNTLTRSKDGTVWIATTSNLLKVNPRTLEEEIMDYPGGMTIGSSWGAWNAGSLCASTQNNVLYWTKGAVVVKYDIDSETANTSFYELGKDNEDKQLAFYGAGVRVDPISDNLVMTVKRSGWGNNGSFNWIHIVKADGNVDKIIVVKGDNGSADGFAGAGEGNYYWFPAVPFFEDANKPEILTNQILLSPGETKTINLNEKIVDADNTSASIIRQVEFADNNLVDYSFKDGILTVTAKEEIGNTTCKMIAISNGKRVEKNVRVDVAYSK